MRGMTDPLLLTERLTFLRELGLDDSERRLPLLSHLVGTRRLLKAWGCRDHLCEAGLFHGLYGLERFDPGEAGSRARADVRSLIGFDAERTVWHWHALDRCSLDPEERSIDDWTTATRGRLSPHDCADLVTLWAADTIDRLDRQIVDADELPPALASTLWRAEPAAFAALHPRLASQPV